MFKYEAPYELERGTHFSAGLDIAASEQVVIPPFGNAIVPTGLKVEMPEGFYGQVTLRSGHGFKRNLLCHVGIIDSDYRGEIKVKLFNICNDGQIIQKGEKFAQLVVTPYLRCTPLREYVTVNTERGEDGFGSTTIAS